MTATRLTKASSHRRLQRHPRTAFHGSHGAKNKRGKWGLNSSRSRSAATQGIPPGKANAPQKFRRGTGRHSISMFLFQLWCRRRSSVPPRVFLGWTPTCFLRGEGCSPAGSCSGLMVLHWSDVAQRLDVWVGIGLNTKTANEIMTESTKQVVLMSNQCCNQCNESVNSK